MTEDERMRLARNRLRASIDRLEAALRFAEGSVKLTADEAEATWYGIDAAMSRAREAKDLLAPLWCVQLGDLGGEG